jgi:ABC-type sulfate/molybdate transport systems ATPase subunit
MATGALPLLESIGLCVRRGGRSVVDAVDLALHRGEVVALLGPNGAGKSSLLAALAGMVTPSSGSIVTRGRIAIALQSPDLARRSVVANVLLALEWWGVPRADRRARALAALELFGVAALADRACGELSGGERRRVHLARAVAVDPDVLLLDEPFAGLDPDARSSLLSDSVARLRSPERATLIVVHDRAEAFALAHRLIVMIAGRVVAVGEPRTLLAAPPTAEVARFLGYDGALVRADVRLLTREANVHLDPEGPLRGRVTRAVALEDGVRVSLEVDDDGWRGEISCRSAWPGPDVGDGVRLRLEGPIAFPRT